MDEAHAAYLAGIIDGEGTITIHRHPQHRRETYQLRPRLTVANTHRGLLETLQARHAGTIIDQPIKDERHKPVFIWRVAAISEIAFLLRAVMPFLIIKRPQAEVVLAFTVSRIAARAENKNARYSPKENALYEQIYSLNRRV